MTRRSRHGKCIPVCVYDEAVSSWLPRNAAGADPGGGGQGCLAPPPFSESLGIDFHSAFRKKNPGIHCYSGFREKKHKGGGVQFEILQKSRYRLL